jgi:hypothetical protein
VRAGSGFHRAIPERSSRPATTRRWRAFVAPSRPRPSSCRARVLLSTSSRRACTSKTRSRSSMVPRGHYLSQPGTLLRPGSTQHRQAHAVPALAERAHGDGLVEGLGDTSLYSRRSASPLVPHRLCRRVRVTPRRLGHPWRPAAVPTSRCRQHRPIADPCVGREHPASPSQSRSASTGEG